MVGLERLDKLVGAIKKLILKETGLVVERESMEIPLEGEKSKGFMFITLQNSAQSQIFIRILNDYPFDKKHTFKIIQFDSVDNYNSLTETYTQPPTEDWVPREHFRHWLADPTGRDQLLLYRGDDATIAWNTKQQQPESAYERTVSHSVPLISLLTILSTLFLVTVVIDGLIRYDSRNGPILTLNGRH